MELTEERVIPDKMNPKNGLLKEHIARYRFASYLARGRVLDIACGVGYGTEILRAVGEGIKEIVGVDIDQESINYAKRKYKYPWNKFLVGDGCDDEFIKALGTFDTIISMETIEHIKDDYKFVENLRRLLRPGGLAVISTPFGRGRNVECSNEYHYRQYKEEEFKELLSKNFSKVTILHQRDEEIELPKEDKKYYLMVALCE